MKRGDIIRETITRNEGEVIYSGFKEVNEGQQFMLGTAFKQYYPNAGVPLYEIKELPDHNPGYLSIVLKSTLVYTKEYKVSWVIEGEAAVEDLASPGSFSIIDHTDPRFTVIKESVSDFQSQVANMSDEELAASVSALRNGRNLVAAEPVKKAKGTRIKVAKEPAKDPAEAQLEALLATMSDEEQKQLKIKLGIPV